MANGGTATFKMNELQGFVKGVTSPRFFRTLKTALKVHLQGSTKKKIRDGDTEQKTKLSALSKKTRKKGSGKPLNNDGHLRRTIEAGVDDNSIYVGSRLPYARIQNFGGTIRRSSGDGYLYLPATRDARKKTAAQSIKAYIDSLKGKGWSIWWVKGKAVVGLEPIAKVKLKQKLKGVKERKARNEITKKYSTVLFWLKKEVKIPARTYLYLSNEDNAQILKLWSTTVKKAGDKKNGKNV